MTKKRDKNTTKPPSPTPNPNPNPSPSHVADEGEDGKEGRFLLGWPTFVDNGCGRWRCTETGHELPEKEKESYSRSRACRLALINAAVAAKTSPLNAFKLHPEFKSKLICMITGDTINKTEEHIWKHINGKRFLNKLEQMELEKMASQEAAVKVTEPPEKGKKSSKSNVTFKRKDKKKSVGSNASLPRESKQKIDDSDDPDFWAPPVGSRWDFDGGKDRWESLNDEDQETENRDDKNSKDDPDSDELTMRRTKRMSIAVGPSSFASRKKKMKKSSEN